ncbi:TetR/AcrR family transcriptional regulator [Enterobacter mori]|uniref:TetR/AcrR family transcriptional regulator n=1 Tax=Enterobacter mori TaxID=539813 RepID=A0A7T0DZZ7_9ENTR|nr:TetR/AcrR family transcriptional regulator [Enterobacter mori]QPK02625.1 TetR/AcrR family transcriptional regulator [Enterobacter mori]
MAKVSSQQLKRRRMPRQERSLVTVDAIFEATIQVLLAEGPIRLNTTRVAERTGVSVGTLYQYFPNKQSLLLALLERHLISLTHIVENACHENLHAESDKIASVVVRAYLEAIMTHAEASPALYYIAVDLDAGKLLDGAVQKSVQAIEKLLASASDSHFSECHVIAQTMAAVLFGTVPVFCMRVMSASAGVEAERQLVLMFRAYLTAHKQGTV